MMPVSSNGKQSRSRGSASATLEGAQELHEPFRVLVNVAKWALPTPLAVLDRDGVIVAVNQAWRRFAREFGACPLATVRTGVNYVQACESAVGSSAGEAHQAAEGIRAVLAGTRAPFTMQCSFPASPTQRRWFLLQVMPLASEQGRAAVAFLDICEHKHLEQRLQALGAIAEAVTELGSTSGASLISVGGDIGPAHLRHLRNVVEVAHRALGCEHILVAAIDEKTEHLQPLIAIGSRQSQERKQRKTWRQWWTSESLPPELSTRLRAGEVVVNERRDVERWGSSSFGRSQALLAPMRSGPDLIGVLELDYGPTTRAVTEAERALAGVTAHLMALELERERLLHEREDANLHELALEESAQRMDEFFALAIHDLRSPLTAAVGGVDFAALQFDRLAQSVLARAPDLADQVEAVYRRMSDTAQSMERLTRLVAVLFDTARAQSGTPDLRRELCDLVAIIREQVSSLRLAHPERVIRMRVQPRAPIRVLADADRIGEVVTNYLTNALKYSPKDRAVAVRVQLAGAWARVSVTDHGPGLPASEQERIWQRFYRSPDIAVHNGSANGLGLGLHICKIFVEAHGGQVGVESKVGQGSTFWFALPLANDAA
jgi:signal transduction histidine kinase